MEIIACLGWLILLVILVVFMCSLMPWWLVLLVFGGAFIYNILFPFGSSFNTHRKPYKRMKNLERVKKEIEERKKAEAKNGKKHKTNYTNINRTSANISAGTYYQKNDVFDYDRYIAAKREEQAAYDDFIASMDLDD